jgi:hypothetical protein
MRENRTYGSEGGGTETNRFSLPLSGISSSAARLSDTWAMTGQPVRQRILDGELFFLEFRSAVATITTRFSQTGITVPGFLTRWASLEITR